MKKRHLLLLFAVQVSAICHAQLFHSFEIKAGIASFKPTHENSDGLFINHSFHNRFDAKTGLALEANIYSKINPWLSIGTGIHYVQAYYSHVLGGIQTELDILNFTVTSLQNHVTINNIGVPLLVRFDVGREKKWLQAVAGMGFYRSVATVSSTKATGAGASDPVFRNLVIQDISNDYNLSAQIGLRALLSVAEHHAISIGGKLEYFLRPDKYYYDGVKGNLLGISASVGYMFSN